MLVAGMVVAGCTGGQPETGPAPPASSTTVAFDPRSVRFASISFDLDAAAPTPPGLAEDVRGQVLATLDTYLRAATLDPLVGGPVGDLTPVFTAAAASRLTGTDRAALVDEGLPVLSDPRPSAAVGLRGLVGPDGQLVVMAALIDVRVVAEVGRQPLTVVRQGALVLVNEGGWKIDGYELRVTRDSGPAGPATTTASLPSPAPRPGAA